MTLILIYHLLCFGQLFVIFLIIQMQQGGVTDINTAKTIARKLYMQYCNGGQMERMAMERMLVDTYRVMVRSSLFRTKLISPLPTILISTIRSWTSIEMEESLLMTFRPFQSNIWPGQKRSKDVFM